MDGELTALIGRLRKYGEQPTLDEAATKQALVLPVLHALGWSVFDVSQVAPEFGVESRKVDYALVLDGKPMLFLEVKKLGTQLDEHQEQLLEYSFREGVGLAVLTNGLTWWFYLPMQDGSWTQRKFYAVDILEHEASDAAAKFTELLSRSAVASGEAQKKALQIYKGGLRRRKIAEALPRAWNDLIGEPDSLLVELLAETVEKLCGYRPDEAEVTRFIRRNESSLRIPQEDVAAARKKKPQTAHRPVRGRAPEAHPTQRDLLAAIVDTLREKGGKASKSEVERCIYKKYQRLFEAEREYWHALVANGVPRWQHTIAWAKERGKHDGLIKSPAESGRGVWELTSRGLRFRG